MTDGLQMLLIRVAETTTGHTLFAKLKVAEAPRVIDAIPATA